MPRVKMQLDKEAPFAGFAHGDFSFGAYGDFLVTGQRLQSLSALVQRGLVVHSDDVAIDVDVKRKALAKTTFLKRTSANGRHGLLLLLPSLGNKPEPVRLV